MVLWQQATPSVLIIQTKESPRAAAGLATVPIKPPKGVKPPEASKETGAPFDISSYFAGELETSGRMRPTVWSMGDPAFRAHATAGRVAFKDEFPKLEDAQAAAGRLKLDYVAVVGGRLKEGALHGSLTIYRGGRKVFEKEDSLTASIGGRFDIEGAAQSICRTWSGVLADGLLKGVPTAPVNPTPDQTPGQVVPPPPVAPLPKTVDNATLLAQASDFLKRGALPEAMALLRDAVDAEPLDVQRRTLFATLLMRSGHAELAAQEARRAASLLQESVGLRALAARAWIAAGKPDEAQADLNEAVARDPENPDVRGLLAEIALRDGKAAVALEHLDQALKKAPSPDLHFKRAVALTYLGNSESVAESLALAGKAPDESELRTRFEFAADNLDRWSKVESGNLVSLFQRALVRRKEPAVADQVVRMRRSLDAYLALGSGLAVPAIYRASQERRLVALRLLVQCGGDLTTFLGNGDEDLLQDARINLGEAIRNLTAARDAFLAERAPSSGS